jgi:hypothetical protein
MDPTKSPGLLNSRQPSFHQVPMRRIGLAVVPVVGLTLVLPGVEAS